MKINVKKFLCRLAAVILGSGLGLLTAGCSLLPIQPAQTDTIRYYTLSSVREVKSKPAAPGPRMMILRVELPAYLQHKPLVVRLGRNEVKVVDEARWAEPLDLGIARVLNVRLAALTAVQGMESREMAHDYDVVVRVRHFEGELREGAGALGFQADIELFKPGSREVAASRFFSISETKWSEGDYAALVQLLSQAVADLAEAIVAAAPGKP